MLVTWTLLLKQLPQPQPQPRQPLGSRGLPPPAAGTPRGLRAAETATEPLQRAGKYRDIEYGVPNQSNVGLPRPEDVKA